MADKPLHICIVTNDFPALTETFVTNKVLELSKRGHQITVIKNNNSGVNKSHVKLVENAGIEVLKMPSISSVKDLIKSPGTTIKSFSLSKKLFKSQYKSTHQLSLLTKHNFDLIHFEFSGLAIFYLDALEKLNCKTVVSCRGTAEKVKPLSDVQRQKNLQQVFSIVDKIHCVSQDMASTIGFYGADRNKIFVNPPSIDTNVFKRSGIYEENNSTIQILSIGRFTFQKGYLIGLLAINELKKQNIDFIWTIVGDGPEMEEMLFHINEMDLGNVVKLSGKKNRDEILALYNSSDIFFLPSVYEGIANVCLEAMSLELPVVSSDCSGMAEVITHDVNGMLASNYDFHQMSSHLQALCNSYTKRQQLGKEARATIQNKFTLKKQVDVFEQEYRTLVQAS